MNNFKNKKSTDSTDLDMTLIKTVMEAIVKPLAHICNISFRTGIFPTNMKIAKIIPIHKSGDKHQFNNYRPISLLSQFSKILEKLFVARLDSFVDKNQLLTKHQYGFRSNRSTLMAATELVEAVSTGVDNTYSIQWVFL